MMNLRTKIRNIFIAVLLSAFMMMFMAGAIYFVCDVVLTEKKPILSNWDVMLPITAREIYYYDTPPSFFGDGLRWNVYAYDKPNSGFFADFESERSPAAESEILEFSGDGDIPSEYMPDFTKEYIWKHYIKWPLMTVEDRTWFDDNMYILYFPAEERMYVVQMFI
jgi:hypothetical protein